MTHVDLLRTITRAVRAHGAAAALAELRVARPTLCSTGYHDTAAVFYVWAVERLVAAGRSDRQILWHPLTDGRSMAAWWDDETFSSAAAREHFVPSTLAHPGEPTPAEPTLPVAPLAA